MIVSHDRAFMDGLVDHVAEIDLGQVTVYAGTYAQYVAARELALEQLKAASRRSRRRSRTWRRSSSASATRTPRRRQAQDRVQKLEKIERDRPARGAQDGPVPLPAAAAHRRPRHRLEGVRKAYGDIVVYDELDFALYRGDKVALVGPNGAGKSTLLKMLAGVLEPDAGERTLGHHVDVAYFAQHQLQALRLEQHRLPGARRRRAGLDAVRGALACSARSCSTATTSTRRCACSRVGRRAGSRSRRCS